MRILAYLLIGLFFANCASHTKSSADIFTSADDKLSFNGHFNCPGYKAKDNQWNPHTNIIEQKMVNGVPMVVTNTRGLEKVGPYNKNIYILDGQWHYQTFYRNGKTLPIKIKAMMKSPQHISWQATYPSFIDSRGKKRPAGRSAGNWKLDANGDWLAEASHFTGTLKCKRIQTNVASFTFKSLK